MKLIKKINILLLLFLLWNNVSLAQSGNNPFELQHGADRRAEKMGISETPTAPLENTAAENPFNVVRTPVPKNDLTSVINPPKVESKKVTGTEVVDDEQFKFWLTLSVLILITLILTIYRSQLGQAYRAFSNENVMRMLHREKGTVAYLPYYILYGLFIINAGIYGYLLQRFFGINDGVGNLNLLGMTTGLVAVLLLAKHLVVRTLGWVFPLQKEASIYSMTITIFGVVMSLVLLAANLTIAYAPSSIIPFCVNLSFFVLGSLYFFRSIRGLSIGSKFLNNNKFHFFIYLCAVELAPVLILWKIAVNGTGIQ